MKHASLNHVYRLVWSEVTSAWVAVAEHRNARGKGRRAAAALVASALLGAAATAHADGNGLPTYGRVAAGAASITQTGPTMTVAQQTDRVVIDWNSFDIGAQNGVRFTQPGSGSIALNRVTGGSASSILGSLTANGQVWLINPGGVVFGSSARVDVGGLVASSLALSNSDFLAGRNRFTDGTGAGAVVNRGRISATGGVVALLAPRVRNEGTITTTGGSTVLAAGDRVSLDFNGDGLVSVAIDRPVVDALVDNSGRIGADGGLVVLSARSANKALDSVVNNTGVIEAKGLVQRNGRILLDGDVESAATHVAGTLDASSAVGVGGTITVTGHDITLDRGATLDASGASGGGSIRVGGGFQGKDAAVANATNVTADGTVTARADATAAGNGGNVVFWSDRATGFAGNLSVRGGPQGGDGGSVEVSGKEDLAYSGRADARAPLGVTGNLLLDPAIVTVSGGGTGTGAITGTTVYANDLQAQNANVLLQATGNVNFNDLNLNGGNGKLSMANNVSLRVEAGTGTTSAAAGDITFANATNTIETFGTGPLLFMAGSLGTGYITNAPNLIAHGVGINPTTLPTHTVTSVGNGTPGVGSVTLYGADGVTVGGSVTTNGGYVRVWADSDNAGGGGYTMSAPVVTNGGNFYVSAGTGAILLNSDMTLGTGRIQFQADGSYTSGARTLGGVLSASGAVNVSTPFTMNAGAGILTDGVITFSNTVNLNTGAGALTLRASAIDFTAATLSNLSTASLILQPANPATSMVLGDANGFASATTLAKLPGVRNLTIGRTDGTGTTSVASNFSFNAGGMLEIVNRNIDITGGTLTNTTGNLTLTGDNVNISQQVTSNAGAGSVTLRQLTAANPIHLGTSLPNSVLGQINAATLVIGRSNGGDVTFDANIATSATSVHLLSGGQVIGTAGGVAAANLAIEAGGGAILTSPTFHFTKLALAVGGPTSISPPNAVLNIAAVNGVAGLAINAGTNADVTLTSPYTISASGTLALNSNTSTVTLNTPTVNLASSTVSGATNTSFALRPLSTSTAITVGSSTGFATATTLAKLTNSRNVTVGRSDGTARLTVGGAVSLAVSGTLELVDGSLAVSGSVTNSGGDVKLNARTSTLSLNANVTAAGQLTLSKVIATGGLGGSGKLTAARLLIDAPSSSVTLTTATNAVGTIAGTAASLSFVDSVPLTVGTVGGVTGIYTTGALFINTNNAADLTLNQAVRGSSTSNAVVLSAGGNFINNVGASAITAAGGGRWLVYSGSPLDDTRGGLSYAFKQYNAAYGSTVLGSGNGFVYRVAPTVTIGLAGSTGKVYDANTGATLTAGNFTTSGTLDGDSVTFSSTGATYGTKDVGTGKSVTANGLVLTGQSNGAAAVYGYQLTGTTATGNIGQITPATITVGATTVADKVYNGNAVATVTNVATSGALGSDVVGTSATGAFADKNVGDAKAVTVSGITLTGAAASNYVLNTTSASGNASITPATLTLTGASVADRVYDTTNVANVNVTVAGRIGSDAVQTIGNGNFADAHVGTAKPVSLSALTLTGNDAANYVLDASQVAPTASITPATVTVGTTTIAGKVYDGNTSATVNVIVLDGVLGNDVIGTTASAAFVDRNVANGKAVGVSAIALTGSNASDYRLASTTASGSANITPATLNVVGTTIANKVYDATTGATVSGIALNGVIGGDVVGSTATGAFADKNVGDGKAVIVGGIALIGADAGNYVLNSTTASGAANITPATLNVVGTTIANKVYDATTAATVDHVALSGVIGSDAIGATATGAFADKNAGNGKAVAVDGIALTGSDSGNYALNTTSTVGIASITPAMLTVGAATIANKVYDATTVATVSAIALNGVIADDAIGATASGAFVEKSVGNGKAVAVSGIALNGTDAGNYSIATSASGTANIVPATLTVGSTTVANKTYDATTVATVDQVALNGVMAGDALGSTATGAFVDKNVGIGKAVAVDVALTGADAGNYVLASRGATGAADIGRATLGVTGASVADKLYDGTTTATVGGVALSGVLPGDRVSANASGRFIDPAVGSGKLVTVNGIALDGSDAGNYLLTSSTTTGRASIASAVGSIQSGTLAALVSTQAGAADGTGSTLAARSDATRPSGIGLANRAADPIIDSGIAPSTSSTGAGESSSTSTRAIETASVAASGSSAGPNVNVLRTIGNDRTAVAMVNVPDTVLTVGSKVSILLGGPDVEPVAASLPVYSVAPATTIRSEGQFFVNDSGTSLSLAPAGDERSVAPSLTQVVSRSAEAMVPLSATESVMMRVALLADRTLVATVSAPASSDATEMLAAYGLVIARTALSTPVDDVRAVVLQYTAAAVSADDLAERVPLASAEVR